MALSKAELCSVYANLFCSFAVLFILIFLFGGSDSWCPDLNQGFCDTFAPGKGAGILFTLLLLIGVCIFPCIFDCIISLSQKFHPNSDSFSDHYLQTANEIINIGKDNTNNDSNTLNTSSSSDSSNNALTTALAKIPILYNPSYDITAFGIEKLHPFDSSKYSKIFNFLVGNKNDSINNNGIFDKSELIYENKFHQCISRNDLLQVHTTFYLSSLTSSMQIMKIVELPGICIFPASFLYWRVLLPMLYQTHGTILGVLLACHYGWSINLGGGFHHASSTTGGGFCVYADISLAVQFIRKLDTLVKKNKKENVFNNSVFANNNNFNKLLNKNSRILICDLDAHQGNGHGRDCKDFFNNDKNIEILDAYNAQIYPNDRYAKTRINNPIVLGYGVSDEYYLEQLDKKLNDVMESFSPHFVIYNAGTDCLEGDPLGCMNISAQGIAHRDEYVFRACKNHNVPVLMVLSGGYQLNNARVIYQSIANLKRKGYI